jgi:EmrB/QacA subfamily drug resistance transporter
MLMAPRALQVFSGTSRAHPQLATSDALDRGTIVVASVVLLGAIMSILDTTVVNVAVDHLAIDFHASLTTIQWVVTGYTLALAAVIPITGWAADRFGTKRIYLASLALFMVGSILCAGAWSAGSLIAFRVLQGLGGGMIMPAVMTIMTQKAGAQRMGRVMGILGVPMLVAPILGPILGGWLVDDVSWRWIFLINVPIGIVAIALAQIVLERDRPQPAHKLDLRGMALLSPGLTLLIFGLAESNGSDGFAAAKSWLPILAGAALIIGFFRHSRRADEPLIDIGTFTHTRAGAAAGTLMLFAIAFFGAMLLIPLYYQTVRGESALDAGLLVTPLGLGAMITMSLGGKLSDRYGPARWAAYGIPLLVIGMIPFAFVDATTSYVLLGGASFVLGLGMGLAMMPTMTAAMQAVPATAIARTSTAMNIIRQSGASIGTAILSVLLASAISDRLSAGTHPSGGGGLDTLHTLSPAAQARAAGPLADAFAHTFVWGLALLALAFLPALAMALGKPADRAVRGRITPDHRFAA